MDQVLEFKQLAAKGVSIREISRATGASRNTVRRYLRGEAIPGRYNLKGGRPQPVREQIEPEVRKLLVAEKDKKTPKKQRLTAMRIHRILIKKGHSCSDSLVRRLVKDLRREIGDPLQDSFLPLAYKPGEDAQVDFYEAWVDDVEKGRVKVFVLLVRACYSRRTFHYAAPNQTQEALFEGLILAFFFFGGVFLKLWFDNLTPAVKKVLKGKKRVMQEAFARFQAHYGFEVEFCAPGKGNEKGGVENAVRFLRRETLSPIPTVQGREGVQDIFDAFMEEDEARTVTGCSTTIKEMWEDEAPHLIPLPACRFDASKVSQASISKRSWVQYGTNFYSLPVTVRKDKVTLKVGAEQVWIYDQHVLLAQHKRIHDRHRMSLKIEHYLPLLRRKTRALDRAIPVQQWLQTQDSCWTQLLRILRKREGEIEGARSWIDAVELCDIHGHDKAEEAVRKALAHPSVSLGTVRYYLAEEEARRSPPAQVTFDGPQVHQGTASAYLSLMQGGCAR